MNPPPTDTVPSIPSPTDTVPTIPSPTDTVPTIPREEHPYKYEFASARKRATMTDIEVVAQQIQQLRVLNNAAAAAFNTLPPSLKRNFKTFVEIYDEKLKELEKRYDNKEANASETRAFAATNLTVFRELLNSLLYEFTCEE